MMPKVQKVCGQVDRWTGGQVGQVDRWDWNNVPLLSWEKGVRGMRYPGTGKCEIKWGFAHS